MFEFTDVEGLDVPRLICHDVQHHGACNAIPLLTHTHTLFCTSLAMRVTLVN